MSDTHKKYHPRVANMLVDNATVFGMPVPTVARIYESAKDAARKAIAGRYVHRPLAWKGAYFSCLRRMLEIRCFNYANKMPDYDRNEIREALLRNPDQLLKDWTEDAKETGQGRKTGTAEKD